MESVVGDLRRLLKSARATCNIWALCLFGILCGIVFITYYYPNYGILQGVFRRSWTKEIYLDLSKNYFLSAEELSKEKFLVDNDKCKVPDLKIWNTGDHAYSKRAYPFKCNQVNLTYVKGKSIIFNEDVLIELGYKSFDDISCCYQTILRLNQSEESFNKEADNQFNYSQPCHQMKKETQPESNFVRVICKSKSFTWKSTIYTNFHLIANFPTDDKALAKKLKYWKQYDIDNSKNTTRKNGWKKGKKRLPNILLIGIDSTSRLNFRRHMTQSKVLLETTLGAVEMNGYTKVGENTFPNFVPLMTSYSEKELTKICYANRWVPQDSCPYIWKEFSDRNYFTAHLEDSPQMAIFNYMKIGFIQKPVDIYLRPWILAAYGGHWTIGCIGNKRPEQIVLDYATDLANLSESQGVPYFITTWLTDLSHDNINNVQHLDSVLSNALLKLHREGLLDNTLLLVMGDHGYRFNDVRITAHGWYEDKLPAMHIKLPNSDLTEYSQWKDALKYNSRQLTTPFDIHATLQQILTTSHITNTNLTNQSSPASGSSKNVPQSNSLRGLSLLKKLPLRNCEEAGIQKEFCACKPPVAFNKNLTIVQMAAEAVIQNINLELPSVCAQLKVASVIAAATLNYSNSDNSNKNKLNFLVSLITDPGNFRFEALVEFNKVEDKFTRVDNILRTNTKTRNTDCLSPKQASLELKCYCNLSIFSI